ncbi:hypothetical protein ACH4TQ_27385 [Streptomyces sp. NPDC021218]|uniref:hypothetical protein n=1 Tax=Streptomyces sp. NPDC021218 TaxID=3365119 RepID=UPI0037AC3907
MTRDLITIALGLGVGCWFIALLKLARTAGARHAQHPAARPGSFRPVVEGTVWRPCHDTACGHMTTRWLPGPDGTYRCERAAGHRGAVHLTRTTTEEGRDA